MGQGLVAVTNGVIEGDDLYRASVVQSVASIDRYVHGIVLDRGVQVLLGGLGPFVAAGKATLTLSAASAVVTGATLADREIAAIQAISASLAGVVFQKADDIAAGVAGVGLPGVWAAMFGPQAGDAKVALNAIVNRRNQIVHTCDLDVTTLHALTPIDAQYALDAAEIVELIALHMDTLL